MPNCIYCDKPVKNKFCDASCSAKYHHKHNPNYGNRLSKKIRLGFNFLFPNTCSCGCGLIVKSRQKFIHGHNRPWLGKKRSLETIRKIKETSVTSEKVKNRGKKSSKALKEGYASGKIVAWNKGLTKETSEIVNKAAELRKGKSRPAMIGNKYAKDPTPEVRQKIKDARLKQIFPKVDTKIEVIIRNFLDILNIKYKPHKVINIKHRYQCDFYLPDLNMVIECDGNYWHKYPFGTEIDIIRTKEMLEMGYKVLRLWESEIIKLSLDGFMKKIIDFTDKKVIFTFPLE